MLNIIKRNQDVTMSSAVWPLKRLIGHPQFIPSPSPFLSLAKLNGPYFPIQKSLSERYLEASGATIALHEKDFNDCKLRISQRHAYQILSH
jgi:hypothetical protein